MRDDKVLGSTVSIDLTTHDSTGALVAPSSAFASDGSDFRIYKDGSAAQKTTQNGITVTSPFDSITGKHLIEIDTSNSTGDSGFWAAGSEYRVEINSAKTISSIVQSGVVVGRFALVAAGVLRPTTDGRTLDVSADHEALAALDSAVRVKLDASQPDYTPATAANLALAKAILDKIDTGLVVDGAVYQFTANMLELGPAGSGGSSDWTADERTAIRSILGIPGSGTTPANPTTGILDTIRDLVVAYIAAALATVDGSSGTIVDFPTSLNIGDSYTDEANASIHVFIRDASDDPITAVGSFNFTDPEFAPEVNITQSGSTGRVKAVVTFVEASPEDYLKVEIPSSQSRRASPGTATIQCLLKWVDTDGKVLCQKTLSKQAVTWNEMV